MSIFSHSVTNVATQVQRVIEDAMLPNSIRDGSVRNMFNQDSNGEQLIENIMEQVSNGVGPRAGRMYKYGKENYIYGLPSSKFYSSLSGQDASKAAIEVEVGGPVSMSYYHFGRLNLVHLAWYKLVTSYGYDSNTNQLNVLSAQKGYPVYLRDMQAVVINATQYELEAATLDVWGSAASAGPKPENMFLPGTMGAATNFMIDPTAPNDYVRVDISWQSVTSVIVEGTPVNRKTLHQESFNIPITGYSAESDYHQARYVHEGKVAYWIYQPGTGSHPQVDAVFNAQFTDDGSFFPFGYLRFNKTDDSLDKTSEKYKSLKKLFKKINMDFDDVAKSINGNPDIANVEQAIVMMAVPANTESEIEQRYLFDFFRGLDTNPETFPVTGRPSSVFAMMETLRDARERNTIIIQDKRFKMALSFEAVATTRVAGSIGKIGKYLSGIETEPGTVSVPVAGGTMRAIATGKGQHWYRHQITENVYEEVRVYGLKMTYSVWAEYTTVGDVDNPILMVPIDVKITKHYSVMDRETLYARGLHYIFNTRVTTDLQWYQTGIFRVALIIGAIIITVASNGATFESIGAAVAAGTITMEMLIILVSNMVLNYLIDVLIVRLFVKIFGVKFAALLAVVAALAGAYGAIESGGLQGAPFAQDLLKLSANLSSAIGKSVQSEMNNLLNEQNVFEEFMEKQTKVLDTAQDLLNHTGKFDPLLIFGETPNEFYQRTVHSGNIGVLGIDAVSSYVDVALRLPKLSETLGES